MATTYEKIATTTLGSAAASITFSSIASSWTDISLIWSCTGTTASSGLLRFNSDSATNYSWTYLAGNGSSPFTSRASSQTSLLMNGGVLSTTNPSFSIVDIFSYAGSTNKTVLINDNQGEQNSVFRFVGLYRSTSPITNISITASASTFAAGTTVTLYGIKAA
jgi:hypothetical protein